MCSWNCQSHESIDTQDTTNAKNGCDRKIRKAELSASLLIRTSPVAQAWNLAMFGNNHFFAFFNSSWGTDEILPGWELASGLAFSESKMAAKDGNRIMRIDISS